MPEQNYANHTRREPRFLATLILAFLCFIASIYHAVVQHTPANILLVPVTLALLLAITTIRVYALKNQDRIIRLEEQTRLRFLGVDCTGLTIKQFAALRFASDAEVGALATRAVKENLAPKQIKQAITIWRADENRI